MKNPTNNSTATLSQTSTLDGVRLSTHFKLNEFIKADKYPDNKPTLQDVVNMAYGCLVLLEPARALVGPIIVNSGFRNSRVNRLVGGVSSSQHLCGQAADIRAKDPSQFQRLVDFLKASPYTDQLLTGSTWLHISWNPFSPPHHFVRLGYYR